MADYPTPSGQRIQDSLSHPYQEYLERIVRDSHSDFEDKVRIVYDELMSLLLKKNKDYGAKNISDAPGGAINGLRVRMHDKLARINNLYDNSRDLAPDNEPFEDSFKDLANYAIIGLLVLRGDWKK